MTPLDDSGYILAQLDDEQHAFHAVRSRLIRLAALVILASIASVANGFSPPVVGAADIGAVVGEVGVILLEQAALLAGGLITCLVVMARRTGTAGLLGVGVYVCAVGLILSLPPVSSHLLRPWPVPLAPGLEAIMVGAGLLAAGFYLREGTERGGNTSGLLLAGLGAAVTMIVILVRPRALGGLPILIMGYAVSRAILDLTHEGMVIRR